MVRAFTKIVANTKDFLKGFVREVTKLVNKDFLSKRGRIQTNTREIVRNAVLSSPEMQSLRSGELGFDLGIPANQDPAPLVADAVANAVIVDRPNFRASGSSINGNFTIRIDPNLFTTLIDADFGKVITEKGQELYWLSWLLEEGDSIIVYGWDVEYGPFGRSGGAHMIEGIGSFKVNPQYSGTPDDNFVTRAIDSVSDQILEQFRS